MEGGGLAEGQALGRRGEADGRPGSSEGDRFALRGGGGWGGSDGAGDTARDILRKARAALLEVVCSLLCERACLRLSRVRACVPDGVCVSCTRSLISRGIHISFECLEALGRLATSPSPILTPDVDDGPRRPACPPIRGKGWERSPQRTAGV